MIELRLKALNWNIQNLMDKAKIDEFKGRGGPTGYHLGRPGSRVDRCIR
jgi:hypothetical protein